MRTRVAVSTLGWWLSIAAGCGPNLGPRWPERGPRPTEDREAVAVASEPSDEPAPFRLPSEVVPTHYALELEVDPNRDEFRGEVAIDLELANARRQIWMHGRGLREVTVYASAFGLDEPVEARWEEVDADEGVGRIVFPRSIGPGAARLRLRYTRAFDASLEGFYRVSVGEDRYAFTQFEPLAARRAFPCFDEPGFKTPFDVTLVVPEGLGAFSNAREIARSISDGWARVRFATTERLPTYLVAFAVGPFDVVEREIAPNDVRPTALSLRGLAPRGRGRELAFAMEHTPRVLEALERWFAIPYPFDKLDVVAVPDFGAGAMENAGLVTFRDTLLLLSESPPADQQRGFAFVMAHELAHQWFGNLVTMQWWDDLWLNEAFASWIETPIVEATFPELSSSTLELATQLEAFDADSLASARVIRQPIESSHDIANAFDDITYAKGASVLAMISAFVGAEAFQAAIRAYLREHARGNATTADLVRALGRDARMGSVSAILESFSTQPGIPRIAFETPECAEGDGQVHARLRVSQRRFLPVGSSASVDAIWTVPVCVTYGDQRGAVRRSCTLLSEREGALELSACPAWVWPNPGGRSYFRFAVTEPMLRALAAPLRAALVPGAQSWREGESGGAASTRDVMTLADAVIASLEAGEVDYEVAMDVLAPMTESAERFVATAPMGPLAFAREHLLSGREIASFERRARQMYASQRRRLGWGVASRSDDPETASLRASVLGFLARTARDPAVRREAMARARAFLGADRGGDGRIHPEAVAPDLLEMVLAVAGEDGALFDRMLDELTRSEDGLLRRRLLVGLSSARNPRTRDRALALALDPRLRTNEVMTPLFRQMSDPEGREHAWTWLEAHYDALVARLGPENAGYLPHLAASFCDSASAERVRSFFGPRVSDIQGGPRILASALETVALCAARAEVQRASASRLFASR